MYMMELGNRHTNDTGEPIYVTKLRKGGVGRPNLVPQVAYLVQGVKVLTRVVSQEKRR